VAILKIATRQRSFNILGLGLATGTAGRAALPHREAALGESALAALSARCVEHSVTVQRCHSR